MTDTETFAEGSEMSDFGKLNALRKELMALRRRTDDRGEAERALTLVANIDNLKRSPGDAALLKQMAKNIADLEVYRAKQRGELQ